MKMYKHKEELAEVFGAAWKVAYEQLHFDFARDRNAKLTTTDCKYITEYVSGILKYLVNQLNEQAAMEAKCNERETERRAQEIIQMKREREVFVALGISKCPRCQNQQIPNDEHAGMYPGALSRTDDETEICSSCGTDEAMEQWRSALTPKSAWPLTNVD